MPPLPEAVAFVAASVDGFIARPDGGLDWLPAPDGDQDYGYADLMATVDALVMGRNTYDVVRSFEGPWPYPDTRVVVLSHRAIDAPEGADVAVSSLGPRDLLAVLANEGARRVYVDGGRTVQAFLRAGLLGELVVTRIPVLLGDGIPLFGPLDGDVPLAHVSTEAFPSGLVQTRYRVARAPGGDQ